MCSGGLREEDRAAKSPQPRSAEPFGSELKAELLTAEAPLQKGGLKWISHWKTIIFTLF
jgi:hypothetical protein